MSGGKFISVRFANQETDIAEETLGMQLLTGKHEITEKFWYLGNTIGLEGVQMTVLS